MLLFNISLEIYENWKNSFGEIFSDRRGVYATVWRYECNLSRQQSELSSGLLSTDNGAAVAAEG